MVFVNFADQRLYAYEPDAPDARPRPLTPCPRWAADCAGWTRGCAPSWAKCGVCWRSSPGTDPPTYDGSWPRCRSTGRRCRTATRCANSPTATTGSSPDPASPDGAQAAWLAWDHPRMPWDGTELILADVTEHGTLRGARPVAGGPEESIAQADWTPTAPSCTPVTAPAGGTSTGSGRTRRSASGRRSSAGRCGRSGTAGSRRWRAGSSPSCTAGAPPRSGYLIRRPARSSTRPALDRVHPDTRGPRQPDRGRRRQPPQRVRGRRTGRPHRPRPGDRRRPRRPGGPRALPGAADPHLHRPRRARGPRPHLPAAPPRPRGTRRRTAALRRVGARWTHRPRALVLDLEIAYFTSRGIGVAEVNYGDRRDTGGSTATGCASSGASSTSRTARPSRSPSPRRAPPTGTGSPSAAAARAAGPPPPP